ncbi:MAG: hypothetical protein IPQ02_00135 [Saprospiraceae bacterium]|nr:hypothetical protein [Candidatus Defluviibacterium haderslevense]
MNIDTIELYGLSLLQTRKLDNLKAGGGCGKKGGGATYLIYAYLLAMPMFLNGDLASLYLEDQNFAM